jgi:hypothetical protein
LITPVNSKKKKKTNLVVTLLVDKKLSDQPSPVIKPTCSTPASKSVNPAEIKQFISSN